jgi:hypothetical protein
MNHFLLVRKSSLKKLFLDVHSLTDESFANLPRNLVDLTIYASKLRTAGLASIGKLGCLKNLAVMDLDEGLRSSDFVTTFQDRNLCQMESLRLQQKNKLGCIDDEIMETITENCPKLTTIYFDLCQGLTVRRGIQCLSLRCQNISKIGVFGRRPGILRRSSACLKEMLENLQMLPKLKVLVMETCDVDQYGPSLEHHFPKLTLEKFIQEQNTLRKMWHKY